MASPLENEHGLTAKQEHAIIALVNEPSIERAAKSIEVTERTIYRWLNETIFSSAYRKARREAFSQAIALSQKYAPVAVNVLAKVMTDTNAPHHARVTAAATILKFGREALELDDLAARLDALEQANEKKDKPSWPSQAA